MELFLKLLIAEMFVFRDTISYNWVVLNSFLFYGLSYFGFFRNIEVAFAAP